VLVTGASSGIGRALALQLAEQGARVVALARREERLAELQQQAEPARGSVQSVAGDITDAETRGRCLAVCRDKLGGLDALVNNAGISAQGRFEEASPDRLRRIMDVNFFAAVELTREALPLLREGRRPIIVNIGSIIGHRGIPFNSEYCASKFALRGFSEALRSELVPRGIDVLLVSPGTTATEFFDNLLEKQTEMPWAQGDGVPPERVARATIRAMERGRREIIPSGKGRMLVWLNRLAPGVLDRVLQRYG